MRPIWRVDVVQGVGLSLLIMIGSVSVAQQSSELDQHLRQEIVAQNIRLEAQQKLLDHQSERISDLGFGLTFLEIFLTCITVAGGLLGYVSVSHKSQKIAESVATQITRLELTQRAATIDEKIAALDQQLLQADQLVSQLQQTEQLATKTESVWHTQTFESVSEQLGQQLAGDNPPLQPTLSTEQQHVLQQQYRQLDEKPLLAMQHHDWLHLGLIAYAQGQYTSAIAHLYHALHCVDGAAQSKSMIDTYIKQLQRLKNQSEADGHS